ncbi:MAG: DUF1634 domain-containing protein [Gammaproteobacteria bacterium]|nr:DUF1634 domain-containing protein [Gammaproteobacteria bacterium]
MSDLKDDQQSSNGHSKEHNSEERPPVSYAGIVYGDIIYWGTLAGAFVVLLGSIITFTTTNNYIDPSYMLSSLLDGKDVNEIWQGAAGVGAVPNGHWYLSVLGTGNGLTMLGIAMGVFSVTPAIFASAYFLLKDGDKLFAAVAAVAGLITIFAMLPS